MPHYYDTCIFQASLNPELPFSAACKAILDTTDITWTVGICGEAIVAECPIEEYLNEFEVDCQRNSVSLVKVTLADSRAKGKSLSAFRKKLQQLGFSNWDWHHFCASQVIAAKAIVTVDEDFFDPSNKINPKSKKKNDRVKRLIEATFSTKVIRPEACPL
jgi:hypothetical protein